jgi:hypothetical protein
MNRVLKAELQSLCLDLNAANSKEITREGKITWEQLEGVLLDRARAPDGDSQVTQLRFTPEGIDFSWQ